jgi:hypothetical protein
MTTTIIRTNADGWPIKPLTLNDDETGLIISNETRVAIIKLLGKLSPNDMTGRGLTDREATLISQLWHKVQT